MMKIYDRTSTNVFTTFGAIGALNASSNGARPKRSSKMSITSRPKSFGFRCHAKAADLRSRFPDLWPELAAYVRA